MKKVIGIGIVIIIFLTVLLFVGLHNIHEEKTSNDIVTINRGQTINFKNYNLKIKLDKIVDSRCPKGVTCIRAGEILYYLEIKYNNKKIDKVIDSTKDEVVTINDLDISFSNYNTNNITINITKK